jgi:large subunit ribosomal protein L4
MAALKAQVLGSQKSVTLDDAVFGGEVKAHLVHEQVRAEMNADRAGTRGAKSRGLVAGGRAKPWRQKGTGRARQGTTRAPHWKGGGVAFPPGMRSFEVKVNKKTQKAALRSALTAHAQESSLIVLDESFDAPSTKRAAELVADLALPLVVVAKEDDEALIKSFRNLKRAVVTVPGDLQVAEVVWARTLLVTQPALEILQARATDAKATA